MDVNFSEYEIKRAKNIERNNAKLRSLGLISKQEEAISNAKAYKQVGEKNEEKINKSNNTVSEKRKKRISENTAPGTRKSARIRGLEADNIVKTSPISSMPILNTKEERKQRVKECREARLRAAQEVANSTNSSQTIKNRTATYDHCLMRVRTMTEKGLQNRIKAIERAAGKHCVVKMAIFKCCLQDESLWDLASLAAEALERLKMFIPPPIDGE